MSETQHPRRTLRSIGAVLAGVLAVIVLSLGTDVVLHATGIYPPWFQPMAHALALGVVGLALSITGVAANWNKGPEYGPKWFSVALIATALPCAWMGGKFGVMQLRSGAED